MKLSGFILAIIMVGLVFAVVGSIVTDFKINYPEVDINITTWDDEYDYSETVNESSTLLGTTLAMMKDEDTGWMLTGILTVAAVPAAIIDAIVSILSSIGTATILITGIGENVGVPGFILSFAITALTVVIIWTALSWWRRSKA